MGAIIVRLVDYHVTDAVGLTEAVFENDQGRFWHVQRCEVDRGDEDLRGVTIQHAHLDRLPQIGQPGSDYDEFVTSYGDSLKFRHIWHELMLAAFRSDEGDEAVSHTISSMYFRKPEDRPS